MPEAKGGKDEAAIARMGAACYARAMTTISKLEHRVRRYALRRGLGTWEVTYEGRRDSFRDQQDAEYVVWLLLHPPPQPIHAVALEMEVSHTSGATGVIKQRSLGLDDAEAVRNLRRQARKLAAVLEDELASELVKADAQREREEILEFLRKNPWRSQDHAQKCVPGHHQGHQAAAQPSGARRGCRGQAAPAPAGLCPASAGAPVDSLRPERRPWRGAGGGRVWRLLHLRATTRGCVEPN